MPEFCNLLLIGVEQLSNNMDNFQQFIGYARYSRWRPELNRREHFSETVRRLTDWWKERAELTDKDLLERINTLEAKDG